MFVGTEHGNRRTGFGQSVGIGEIDVRKQLHRLADRAQRHLAAAVGEGPQRRQIRRTTGGHQMIDDAAEHRSEEHTSELQSLMRISYAVFCLKNKTVLNILFDMFTHKTYTHATSSLTAITPLTLFIAHLPR